MKDALYFYWEKNHTQEANVSCHAVISCMLYIYRHVVISYIVYFLHLYHTN